jgi:hypothetical protein
VKGRDCFLGVSIPHIAVYGLSFELLFDELEFFYRDPSIALPELKVQYGDYAVWQRKRVEFELDSPGSYFEVLDG